MHQDKWYISCISYIYVPPKL